MRGLGVALLAAALAWPTIGACQPRSVNEVQAICLKEIDVSISYHLTSEKMVPALKRGRNACCQELSDAAAKMSPLQRGLTWSKLGESIALKTRSGEYRAARDATMKLQGQLTLPQASAARGLIVDRLRCFKRFGDFSGALKAR